MGVLADLEEERFSDCRFERLKNSKKFWRILAAYVYLFYIYLRVFYLAQEHPIYKMLVFPNS